MKFDVGAGFKAANRQKSDESNKFMWLSSCVLKFAMQIVRDDFVTAWVTMVSIKSYS